MVKRMAGPPAISAGALSLEVGIPQPTLSRWLREASTLPPMGDRDNQSSASRAPTKWTPTEKLRVLGAAAVLPDEALGELLRREGLHSAQLTEWRDKATTALAGRKERTKDSQTEKRIRSLERDLGRKNAALAEVTALLALKKKVQSLWGDEDESTPPRKGS
jgi:hypothetical protein